MLMNEIVRGSSRQPVEPPSFASIEPVLAALSAAREASVIARVASPQLLAQLNGAMDLALRRQGELSAATQMPTSQVAGYYLAVLMQAYSTTGLHDAKGFGRLLLEDVLASKTSVSAIEIACRRWRRGHKFLPAISELLAEMADVQRQVDAAVEFVARLPDLRDRCARELGHR